MSRTETVVMTGKEMRISWLCQCYYQASWEERKSSCVCIFGGDERGQGDYLHGPLPAIWNMLSKLEPYYPDGFLEHRHVNE